MSAYNANSREYQFDSVYLGEDLSLALCAGAYVMFEISAVDCAATTNVHLSAEEYKIIGRHNFDPQLLAYRFVYVGRHPKRTASKINTWRRECAALFASDRLLDQLDARDIPYMPGDEIVSPRDMSRAAHLVAHEKNKWPADLLAQQDISPGSDSLSPQSGPRHSSSPPYGESPQSSPPYGESPPNDAPQHSPTANIMQRSSPPNSPAEQYSPSNYGMDDEPS